MKKMLERRGSWFADDLWEEATDLASLLTEDSASDSAGWKPRTSDGDFEDLLGK